MFVRRPSTTPSDDDALKTEEACAKETRAIN
jgi:hypothetical protein